jgi:hypothetical protein
MAAKVQARRWPQVLAWAWTGAIRGVWLVGTQTARWYRVEGQRSYWLTNPGRLGVKEEIS